jgi:hypothetical protein
LTAAAIVSVIDKKLDLAILLAKKIPDDVQRDLWTWFRDDIKWWRELLGRIVDRDKDKDDGADVSGNRIDGP